VWTQIVNNESDKIWIDNRSVFCAPLQSWTSAKVAYSLDVCTHTETIIAFGEAVSPNHSLTGLQVHPAWFKTSRAKMTWDTSLAVSIYRNRELSLLDVWSDSL
jgi:hypothetical protein